MLKPKKPLYIGTVLQVGLFAAQAMIDRQVQTQTSPRFMQYPYFSFTLQPHSHA